MFSSEPIGQLSIENRVTTSSQRWVHVGSRLDPRFGGIASSLPALCRATSENRRDSCTIIGFCGRDESTKDLQDPERPFVRLPLGRARLTAKAAVRKELTSVLRQADGVHIHGIWDEHCSLTGSIASQLGIPYIVSAHGMLEKWAVGQKNLKKAIYSAIFERETLRRSSCLRALTANEVEDYRRYGVHGPVAVIPNGVETPRGISPEPFLNLFPELEGKRLVLFLGRIHLKKGLDTLCGAWCRIRKQMDDAHLVIAGPDCGNTQEMLKQIVGFRQVTFTGMLNSAIKWSALAASTLFVLPSHSEGFSVAVLEALAAGVPVIVSRNCNFPEIAQSGCGWETEVTEFQIEQSLTHALGMAPEQLRLVGSRGQQLVNSNYSWSAVGSKMRELQNWILFGTTPSTIRIQ